MRIRLFRYAFAVTVLCLVASGAAAQSGPDPISWYTDLERARSESDRRGLPILVYVTGGIWCDPCEWLEVNVLQNAAIATLIMREFIPVRLIDTGEQRREFDVERLPTVIVVDREGAERLRLDGALSVRSLETELVRVVDRIAATAPPPEIREERDPFTAARFRIGSGTLWNTGDGRWRSEDAGLPPQLEEFDRDESFLYLRDRSSGTVLAISVLDGGGSLWRWGGESWIEVAVMTRLPENPR